MTIEQRDTFPGGSAAPPAQAERTEAAGTDAAEVASLMLKRFSDYCRNEGLTIERLAPIQQSIITDTAHSYTVGRVTEEMQGSGAKLLPAYEVDSQMNDYFRNRTMRSPSRGERESESMVRFRQLVQFRREHIDLALQYQAEYPQIEYAEQILAGAWLARNNVVFAGIADLLTCYGMALERMGRRKIGGVALNLPPRPPEPTPDTLG